MAPQLGYEQFFHYFYRTALCHYRDSPDLYWLDEDDMGGTLKPVYELNPPEASTLKTWIQVRFGFRRLMDDRIGIAGLKPDLAKLPREEQLIWQAHHIEAPVFAQNDPAFNRWVARYLDAKSGVDSGPKPKILNLLRLIRATTQQTLGNPLFKLCYTLYSDKL